MANQSSQILKINSKDWYVETKTGYDGPFLTEEEAESFLDLVKCSNAARVEFAGLQYTPLEG